MNTSRFIVRLVAIELIFMSLSMVVWDVDVAIAQTLRIGGLSVTPSPSVSEDEIRESIKDRLQKAAEEKSTEADQILGARARRALVGTVKDITNTTVTLTTKTGMTRLAALSGETTVVKSGKTIKVEELAIGDTIIAMGYPSEQEDILDARRVVVDGITTRSRERVLIGTVTGVTATKRTFTLSSPRPTELGGPETIEVTIPRNAETSISELEPDSRVVIIGTSSATNASSLTLLKLKTL